MFSLQKIAWSVAFVAIVLLTFGFVTQPTQSGEGDGVFRVQVPAFVSVAQAESKMGSDLSAILGEVGISAYFQKEAGIDLGNVRGLYRTIEAETATYIIGVVYRTTAGNYTESQGDGLYVTDHRIG
jgi:hypothetical protein